MDSNSEIENTSLWYADGDNSPYKVAYKSVASFPINGAYNCIKNCISLSVIQTG